MKSQSKYIQVSRDSKEVVGFLRSFICSSFTSNKLYLSLGPQNGSAENSQLTLAKKKRSQTFSHFKNVIKENNDNLRIKNAKRRKHIFSHFLLYFEPKHSVFACFRYIAMRYDVVGSFSTLNHALQNGNIKQERQDVKTTLSHFILPFMSLRLSQTYKKHFDCCFWSNALNISVYIFLLSGSR